MRILIKRLAWVSALYFALGLLTITLAAPVFAAPNITIVSRTPGANTLNVSLSSNIVVQFSENINSGTVSASTFRVHGSISGRISGAFDTTGAVVTFNPTSNFKPGEIVQVTLTTGIHDATDGDGLAAPVVYQFRASGGSGTGVFNTTQIPIGNDNHTFVTSMAIADFNGDGWLDIAKGNKYQADSLGLTQSKVFFNDGDGTYDNDGYDLGPSTDSTIGVAAGDFDNDGDMDIAVGNEQAANKLYYNNGSGVFDTNESIGGTSGWNGINTGDFNGDGWLDIVIAPWGGNLTVHWNDGTGHFSSVTTLIVVQNYITAVGDVENDGDLDIIVPNWGGQLILFTNDGTGTFANASFGVSGNTHNIALGDLDGDGDLDLIQTISGAVNSNIIYKNNGGVFTQSSTFGATADDEYAVCLADIDSDGDLDIVEGSDDIYIYTNTGDGSFNAGVLVDNDSPHPRL